MPACRALPAVMGTALLLCGPAWANGQASETTTPQALPTKAVVAQPATTITGLGQVLSTEALERYRGGDDSTENHVHIDGQLDGNTAQDIASGNNTVGGDAFANASGLSTVIQNSGSNVLIQNGMVVNVRFAGAGP